MSNSFEKPRKHPREDVQAVFGPKSSATLAGELKRNSPALYQSIKKQAIDDGLLAPAPRKWYEPTPARIFSQEELDLRARHSLEETKAFFQSENLAKIKREAPELYATWRTLGVSYGILDAVTPDETRRPSDPFFILNDALADEARLPRGTRVDQAGFERVLLAVENARTSKEAEATAVAAKQEPVAE